VVFLLCSSSNFAAITITPASNGSNISADTVGGTYTSLTGPVITEGANQDVTVGTIVITAPTGFVFNTASPVTATVANSNGGGGAVLTLASSTATPTASTITFTVSAQDTTAGGPNGKTLSSITFSGIQVRPTAGTPLASGNLTFSGTATVAGNAGVLTEVAGVATKLVFTTAAITATAGVASGTITVQRQDQFGNPNTTDATRTVTLASTSSGTVTFTPASPRTIAPGASSFNFTYTDTKSGTPTITAASTSPTTITSATQVETINPGPGNAGQSTVAASPTSVAADNSATSTITVTLKDANANVVPGKTVTLSKTSGPGTPTVTTVQGTTDSSGVALFTVKSSTAGAAVFTAVDVTDAVTVTQTATVTFVALDYGDLPDTGAGTGIGNYETLLTSNGPRHMLSNTLKLGATVDADDGTLQNAGATADDSSNTGSADDEDGVNFTGVTLYQGQTASLPVTVTLTGGGTVKLNAFFDFNNNGSFADAGEALTELTVVVPGGGSTTVNLSVPVPAGATTGVNLGARFRISTAGGLTSVGLAADGEVEDYVVQVQTSVRLGNRVWLDNGAGGGTSDDGLITGTEAGINGVTVTVYAADAAGYATGSVLRTTTTASGGYYGFNLPPGDYVVVIPASNFGSGQPLFNLYSSGTSNNTRNGADPDTNATDSDDNGFNAYNPSVTGVYSAAITLTVGGEPTGETDLGPGEPVLPTANSNLTLDFGFVAAAPTAIKLSYVKGWWIDGRVTVEWETVSELNTLGFELYRLQGSDRIRVNADLVPALNVERGGVYRVDEAMDRPTTTVSYILVEQETTGNRIEYGPFGISIQSVAKPTSARVVSGALVLRFAGEGAAEYQIESTDDLANGHWVPVGRLTADPGGTIEYQQRLVESEPVRFYRALRP